MNDSMLRSKVTLAITFVFPWLLFLGCRGDAGEKGSGLGNDDWQEPTATRWVVSTVIGEDAEHVFLRCRPGEPGGQILTCEPPPLLTSVATSSPLPFFLRKVVPAPDEIVPIQTYQSFDEEHHMPVGLPYLESGYASSVCVRIDVSGLVQPGDDFREVDAFLERTVMRVDQVRLTELTRWSRDDILGLTFEEPTPTAVFSGPFGACWRAELDVGWHQAEVTFRATDDELFTYRWRFSLVESQ
jgi:hypothetical protein